MGDDWDNGSVAQKSSGFGAATSGFGTGDMRGMGRGKTDDANNNSSGGFGSGGFGSGGGGSGGFGSGGGGFGSSGFGSSNDNGGGFGSRGGGGERRGGSGCFKCGEEGHMSRDCPKGGSGGGGGGGKGCFKCGEEGHMSRDCPSGGGGGGASRGKGCFKCGEEGHMSRDCPNPGAGGGRSGGGGGGKGCFKCGEEGHMSRDCPNPGAGGGRSGGGGGGKGCFKCGEEGHMSRDCPNPGAGGGRSGGGGGGKGCFKCGEEGHMSRDCPSGGGGGAGGSRGKGCFKCGEEGHMSRDCPGAQNGGGGFGGATGGGFGAATGGGFGAATGGGFGAATGGGFGGASSDEPRGGGFSGGDSAPKKSGCFKCGQDGHISRDCTNEAAATTGPDGEKRAPPYVPPEAPEDDESLYATLQKGINFDKYDNIPVECTGRDAPRCGLTSFADTELHAMLKENIMKSKYDKPTPIQKWAIPIIMGGRDMMACAQTGSGKTAAFLLPVLTGMLRNGVEGSAFSAIQEPQAIIVGPTRELVTQIYNEARKFSHNTMVRPVVVYGGVTTGYQAREVGKGAHLVVGTAGRLLDFIEKGYISLAKVKYFILDEADRMLDMGFLPSMQKLANQLGMPAKTERQTLMFSATFPEEVQQLARELLNDYIFVTVGRVGGANTDIEQHVVKVDQFSKRDQLVSILNAQGSQRTLVFVETKRQADFLASFLSQSEFPTTSIHGDREQREREEALRDFKKGTAPILVATSVAARGLDIPGVNHVINFDMPAGIDEYVHRIGRTGRCGNLGRATSFFNPEQDGALARPLVKVLVDAQQEIPEWLEQLAGDSHGSGGFTSGASQFKDTRRGNFGGGGDSVASAPAAAAGGDEWD